MGFGIRSKGCELLYPGKESESAIISNTKFADLILLDKYGSSRPKNMLIHGDNLPILKTLKEKHRLKGKVKLIYIDPPFATGQSFLKSDSQLAYSDTLINFSFLEFLRKRLIFLRELLADDGSIYVHIDTKIGHYVKILLDEIFGQENFRNDISRIKCNPKNFERKAYGNIKDVIFFYSKTKPNGKDILTWNDCRIPLSEAEIKKQFPKIDKEGRRYATTPLHAKGETLNGPTGQEWKGMKPPKGRHWRYSPEELTRLDKLGLIEWSSTGNPRKKIYPEDNKGKKVQDLWNFKDPGDYRNSYPTEKNFTMLEQIILASSNEGDLVMDCFCGSGTTCVAADNLNRRWIGIDSSSVAIEEAKKRLTGGLLASGFGYYESIKPV